MNPCHHHLGTADEQHTGEENGRAGKAQAGDRAISNSFGVRARVNSRPEEQAAPCASVLSRRSVGVSGLGCDLEPLDLWCRRNLGSWGSQCVQDQPSVAIDGLKSALLPIGHRDEASDGDPERESRENEKRGLNEVRCGRRGQEGDKPSDERRDRSRERNQNAVESSAGLAVLTKAESCRSVEIRMEKEVDPSYPEGRHRRLTAHVDANAPSCACDGCEGVSELVEEDEQRNPTPGSADDEQDVALHEPGEAFDHSLSIGGRNESAVPQPRGSLLTLSHPLAATILRISGRLMGRATLAEGRGRRDDLGVLVDAELEAVFGVCGPGSLLAWVVARSEHEIVFEGEEPADLVVRDAHAVLVRGARRSP